MIGAISTISAIGPGMSTSIGIIIGTSIGTSTR